MAKETKPPPSHRSMLELGWRSLAALGLAGGQVGATNRERGPGRKNRIAQQTAEGIADVPPNGFQGH
jgi:hypothetical protein